MRDNFIVYVDFDATLYDTAAFAGKLWTLIAYKTNLTPDEVQADSADYFFHPYLGGYEYQEHITKYGLDPAEMWGALDDIVSQHDFLYPDSIEFIQSLRSDGYDPHILTFGETRFQLAKIKPVIQKLTGNDRESDIGVTIVNQRKLEHIRTVNNGQRGVLVDDKPDQMLPAGFTEIHLRRGANIDAPIIRGAVVAVSDLGQARKVIDQLVLQA